MSYALEPIAAPLPDELVRAWTWLGNALPVRLGLPPLDGDWFPVADLADPRSDAMSALLAYQRSFGQGMDGRTQAAYLVGQYSYFFALPVAAACLREHVVPVTEWPALSWRISAERDGLPGRFELGVLSADVIRIGEGSAAGELTALFERHLAPLVEAVRARTGFGRQAQWRIVADSIASAFLDVGKVLGDQAGAALLAEAVLKARGSHLFNSKLAFRLVCASDGRQREIFRLRGGCCRYYKTDGGSLCATCVLRNPDEQLALLRRFLDERER